MKSSNYKNLGGGSVGLRSGRVGLYERTVISEGGHAPHNPNLSLEGFLILLCGWNEWTSPAFL
jgi:hypothetical protein